MNYIDMYGAKGCGSGLKSFLEKAEGIHVYFAYGTFIFKGLVFKNGCQLQVTTQI